MFDYYWFEGKVEFTYTFVGIIQHKTLLKCVSLQFSVDSLISIVGMDAIYPPFSSDRLNSQAKPQSCKWNPLGIDKPRDLNEAFAAVGGEVVGHLLHCHSHRQQLLQAQLLLQFWTVPKQDVGYPAVYDGAEQFLQVVVFAELEREYLSSQKMMTILIGPSFTFREAVHCLTPQIRWGTESVGLVSFTLEAKLMNLSFLTGFTSLPNQLRSDFAYSISRFRTESASSRLSVWLDGMSGTSCIGRDCGRQSLLSSCSAAACAPSSQPLLGEGGAAQPWAVWRECAWVWYGYGVCDQILRIGQNQSLLWKVAGLFPPFCCLVGQFFMVCLTDPHPKHEPPFLYSPFSLSGQSLAMWPFLPQQKQSARAYSVFSQSKCEWSCEPHLQQNPPLVVGQSLRRCSLDPHFRHRF